MFIGQKASLTTTPPSSSNWPHLLHLFDQHANHALRSVCSKMAPSSSLNHTSSHWKLAITISRPFKVMRRQTRRSRAGLRCRHWTRKLFPHGLFVWGTGFGVGLMVVVLSEYGHREQDQFLEEKRKGSRKVGFRNSLFVMQLWLLALVTQVSDCFCLISVMLLSAVSTET